MRRNRQIPRKQRQNRQSETYPNEPSQSESEPVEPSVSESEPKDPPESEPSEPSQSETPPPEETTPRESETTSPPQTEPETPKVDEPPARPTLKAPDFTVLDMNGNKVKLSDYTGKPIVVNYWATWCGYCMIEMPDFENMYKKYGDRVNFLMVNAGDDSLKDVQQYASKSGYSFPMFFDSTGEAANAYSAYAYPTTYFFYADGNPGYRKVGVISAEALEDTILKLLNY